METETAGRGYHPVWRLLGILVPAAALIAIALVLWTRRAGGPGEAATAAVPPPAEAAIPWVAFAPIDTIIAGGTEAFARRDWDEAARLLSRARFFVDSGIREGSIGRMPDDIDLFIGLAEFYRGYAGRGIESAAREVERDPLDARARWYLASMLAAAGRSAEARSHLETLAGIGGPWSARAREALERL